MPQPIVDPTERRNISDRAITMKVDIMPVAEARKPSRTSRGLLPLWLIKENIFKDNTGSTQGIRFRINPPIKASNRIKAIDGATTILFRELGGMIAVGAISSAGIVISAAVLPLTIVTVKRVPASDFFKFSLSITHIRFQK